MSFIPGMTGPVAIMAARRASATYISKASSTSDLTTYTFSSQNIGTAADDRVVVVGIWGRAAGTSLDISGVTIGGNAAAQICKARSTDSGNTNLVAIYALLVTSGTAADIVLTFGSGAARAGIGVWGLTGTGGSATAADTGTSATGTPDPTTVSLDIAANAAAVAIASDGSGSSHTTTWGVVTEDFDDAVENNTITGAHVNGGTGAGLTVSADWSGTPTDPVLAAASWVP